MALAISINETETLNMQFPIDMDARSVPDAGSNSGGDNNTYPPDWEEGIRNVLSFKQLNINKKNALVSYSYAENAMAEGMNQ